MRNEGDSPTTKRRQFYPTTELRAERCRAGLTLAEVAAHAGLTLTRASYVERDPSIARAGEVEALRESIRVLAAPPLSVPPERKSMLQALQVLAAGGGAA